jgi:hypothetical protein
LACPRHIAVSAAQREDRRNAGHFVHQEDLCINWKFDRKAARRKFGYKKNSFTRSWT